MNDYTVETDRRVAFVRGVLETAGAAGVVFGNSGGKDCALAGALCKLACGNTLGLVMPCGSRRNYESDKTDAGIVAEHFGIETRYVDLTLARNALVDAFGGDVSPSPSALANIAPRLRMTALYAIAASENRLVAGTGNRSERYMGYFTKWGDGAFDFNPIADLTVTEVYEFLRHLGAPACVMEKAPSAGLSEGQTDEAEMGVTYREIDEFLLTGSTNEIAMKTIARFHKTGGHKRVPPPVYGA